MANNTPTNNPFGIYIHWPYCRSKCPYCDFFSQVQKEIPQDKIINEYLEDLNFYANKTPKRMVTSVFFGGGTPSLITPNNIEKILHHISSLWPMAKKAEITLEANPNSEYPQMFQSLKQAGINRLSLGVQALNEKDLRFLGRTHTLQQALHAAENVLNTFDNHSIDIIYARPHQTQAQWQTELKEITQLGFKHLSLYQLTIEEGTLFAKKGIQPLEEEKAARLYSFSQEYLASQGYEQYEVSNYAQKGYASKHNLIYWQGDDYVGIGPSAHGRLKLNNKFFATEHPRLFTELTPQERAEELLLMGLRLTQGINKEKFYQCCGLKFDEFIAPSQIKKLENLKLIKNKKQSIHATSTGFLVLNYLIRELCP